MFMLLTWALLALTAAIQEYFSLAEKDTSIVDTFDNTGNKMKGN